LSDKIVWATIRFHNSLSRTSAVKIIRLLAFLVFLLPGFAQESASDAEILFYSLDSAKAWPVIYHDNQAIGTVSKSQFVKVVLSPGNYRFTLRENAPPGERLSLSPRAGQQIFIRVQPDGFYLGSASEAVATTPTTSKAAQSKSVVGEITPSYNYNVTNSPSAVASPSSNRESKLTETIRSQQATINRLEAQIANMERTLQSLSSAAQVQTSGLQPNNLSTVSSPTPSIAPVRPAQTVTPTTSPRPPSTSTTTGEIKPLCAENGSCYGDISPNTGRPKTVAVRGYYRKDGTYVRGHYRSAPRK
jgi:hypothetical protein